MVQFILDYFDPDKYDQIVDCFCGTGSVSIEFHKQMMCQRHKQPQWGGSDKPVFGTDKLKCMITTLQAVQNGYVPPSTTTKEEFDECKFQDENPLKAFLHVLCGRSGRVAEREFHDAIEIQLLKMPAKTIKRAPELQGLNFIERDYQDWSDVKGALIYCDPPYFHCKKTWPKNFVGFDHDIFWDWVRMMSKENIVVVSEYSAPSDFKEIWSKTFIACNWGKRRLVNEKLFVYDPSKALGHATEKVADAMQGLSCL